MIQRNSWFLAQQILKYLFSLYTSGSESASFVEVKSSLWMMRRIARINSSHTISCIASRRSSSLGLKLGSWFEKYKKRRLSTRNKGTSFIKVSRIQHPSYILRSLKGLYQRWGEEWEKGKLPSWFEKYKKNILVPGIQEGHKNIKTSEFEGHIFRGGQRNGRKGSYHPDLKNIKKTS